MSINIIEIPINTKTKAPLIKAWQKLDKSPDMKDYKGCNTGLITGEKSGFIVFDIDIPKPEKKERDGVKKFNELIQNIDLKTRIVRTKSGGLHVYFKYDPELSTKNIGINGYSIDLLTNNNYVIAPPSKGYELIEDYDICVMPDIIKEFIMIWRNRNKEDNKQKITDKSHDDTEFIYLYDNIELQKVLDILPPKYYNDTKEWIKITSILKSCNEYNLWSEFSKKSNKYDKDANDKIYDNIKPYCDLTYIKVIIKKEKLKIKFNVSKTIDFNLFTKKPNLKQKLKYVDINNFNYHKHRHLLIKAHTGTGKTHNTAKLISKINKNDGYKVISIVSRRSLSYQHCKNFKEMNMIMINYQDVKPHELMKQKHLVIQIDSIIKLRPNDLYNTIIYLDEINSIIDYLLNSGTLKNKRLQVYNTLCLMIYYSSYVIGVDAELSNNCIDFLEGLNCKPYVIHNTFKNAKSEAIKYNDKNKMISIMKTRIKNNERFICCFDSFREQNLIVEELKQYCERKKYNDQLKDFLPYSSEDGKDEDLKDVQENWKNKYIFYTPTIVYGLDYVPDEKMDVFGFFQCTSINPLGFCQMLNRCRKIKTLRYFIRERNINLQFTSVESLKNNYEELLTNYENITNELDKDDRIEEIETIKKKRQNIKQMEMLEYDNKTGEYVISNKLFEKLYYQSEFLNHIMKSSFNYHFQRILEDKGFIIKSNDTIAKHKIDEKKLKECVKNNKEKTIEQILKTEDEELNDKEIKIKKAMIKRADILKVNLHDTEYYDIITDDRNFTEHLNMCNLLSNDYDDRLVDQTYKDAKIKNVKSTTMKIKLIKDLGKKINKHLDIDFYKDIERFDEPIDISNTSIISKTFRFTEKDIKTYSDAYVLYINMIKNICKMKYIKRATINDDRYYVYEFDHEIIRKHLKLLEKRNKKLSRIDTDILDFYDYEKQPRNINKIF